jgi:hypothetical protein
MVTTTDSAGENDSDSSDKDSVVVAAERMARVRRQGATQLANAIITNNPQAITQILLTYQDDIDLNYVDEKHSHPLASLAILAGLSQVAIQLIEKGADPLKLNGNGRSVLYIATESGLEEVIRAIFKKYPEIDLDVPITTEIQRYRPIHVAAR